MNVPPDGVAMCKKFDSKADARTFWPETRLGRWMADEYEAGLVSVIIPTYHRSRLLVDAMDSVLAQTYRPIELLVVDDGSRDGTREAVEAWRQKCAADVGFSLRYLYQENHGVSAARNYGLVESRGQFIQFLDSDDLLLPHKFATQVAVLAAGTADYVYGTSQFLDAGGKVTRHTPGRHFHDCRGDRKPYVCMPIWDTNSVLYHRRACCANGPWNEQLVMLEDQEYAARIKASCFHGMFLDDVFDLVREHCHGKATSPRNREAWRSFCLSVESAVASMLALLEHNKIENDAERCRLARDMAVNAVRWAEIGERRDALRCLRMAQSIATRLPQRIAIAVFRCACQLIPLTIALRIAKVAARLTRRVRLSYLAAGDVG